jgi:hypothetical protein
MKPILRNAVKTVKSPINDLRWRNGGDDRILPRTYGGEVGLAQATVSRPRCRPVSGSRQPFPVGFRLHGQRHVRPSTETGSARNQSLIQPQIPRFQPGIILQIRRPPQSPTPLQIRRLQHPPTHDEGRERTKQLHGNWKKFIRDSGG